MAAAGLRMAAAGASGSPAALAGSSEPSQARFQGGRSFDKADVRD